jgi:tripartite ATP-independent transporter DctM subunit
MSVDGIFSFTLLAVPLFIMTGDLIVSTGVAEDLYEFAASLLGWLPSGIGVATQGACGLFAAISGSNAADAAAIGRVSTAELFERGYPKAYAGGLVASASITGILIPPSISYIVLGLVMRISVSDLFIGTIIPGILVLAFMMVVHLIIARVYDIDQGTSQFDLIYALKSAWAAKYGLVVPVIILGGLYAGLFTATEAAIVAIMFMVGIGIFLGKFVIEDWSDTVYRSAALNGMVMPLVAIFVIFSQAIGYFQLPDMFVDGIFTVTGGTPILVLFAIIIILILAGTVISTIPNILLFGPLLIPLGTELGYHPVHFSIFFLITLALGFITPPVGLNLFVLAGIIDEPVEEIAVWAVPFFIAGLAAALVVLAFPELVLTLVEWSG